MCLLWYRDRFMKVYEWFSWEESMDVPVKWAVRESTWFEGSKIGIDDNF